MSCTEILGVDAPREAVWKWKKEKASSFVIANVRSDTLYGTMMFSYLWMFMMVQNYVTPSTYYQFQCRIFTAIVFD